MWQSGWRLLNLSRSIQYPSPFISCELLNLTGPLHQKISWLIILVILMLLSQVPHVVIGLLGDQRFIFILFDNVIVVVEQRVVGCPTIYYDLISFLWGRTTLLKRVVNLLPLKNSLFLFLLLLNWELKFFQKIFVIKVFRLISIGIVVL